MSAVLAVCLAAVAIHLICIPALIWSIRTRQGRESDAEAYRAMQPARTSVPIAIRTSTRAPGMKATDKRWDLKVKIFLGFIIVMLASMAAAQIYLAVRATQVPAAIPAGPQYDQGGGS